MFLAAEYGFMFYRFRELVCLRRPSRQSRSAPPASHMLTGWVPCEAAGASRFTAHTKSPQSQSVHRLQGKPSFNDGVKKKEKEKWNDFFIWSEIKWNHICLPTNNRSFNVFHWFFIIFSLTFSHVSKCSCAVKTEERSFCPPRAVGTLTSTVQRCPLTSHWHLKEPFASPSLAPGDLLGPHSHHTRRLHSKGWTGLLWNI